MSQEPNHLDELKSLAETAGYNIVFSLEQIRHADPKYQIGEGKAEELTDLVKKFSAEKIIFDNQIKPVQAFNLAKLTGVEVVDRFQLILEIFARNASTSEAKLEIELARLQYELPRAKDKVRLARLEEQPGFMGLGRYEVDLYYESIIRQTAKIREKLRRIGAKRRLHRTRRLDLGFSLVSLSGYTNAGKSTLFNALAKESVPVDSGLFTTLSTTTRAVELSKRKVLLTDTVGFIDRLPLTLIDAFHSTLEETVFSDLILLVVDVSDPQEEIARKLSSSLETMRKIGAAGIPIVSVLNKIDAVSENEMQSKLEAMKEAAPNPVPVSALHGDNLPFLKQEIANHLENYIQVFLSMPVTDESMSFLSWLFNRVDVHDLKYRGKMVDVVFSAIPKFVDEVKGRAEQLSGTLKT